MLGPLPPIPETGWRPPAEFPNIIDAPWISLDCETYDPELDDFGPGWARGKGHIVGVSIAVPWGKWYFPMRHSVQKDYNLDPEKVLDWLRYSLSGRQPKIGANIIYDLGWLRQEGVIVNGPLYDVQYAEALLDEVAALSLDELGWRHLKRGKLTAAVEEWVMNYYQPPKTKWRREIHRAPPSLVGPYAEEDAQMPYEILLKQWPQLVARKLMDLFEMECRGIRLLLDMRFAGITVDLAYTEKMRDEFVVDGAALLKQAEYIAGTSLNVNSSESIAAAFDKLGLSYTKTAAGNASFTKDWLKVQAHPLAKLITSIRELDKLRSTFAEGYILEANVNGKIFCSFHPLMGEGGGAKTGRYSSSDPNLQNIPTRTKEGKRIRQAFICDAGHKQFRSHDHSQVEYRMLAHYAVGKGSDDVRARYRNDPKLDYHGMIGQIVKEVTGIDFIREIIKNINFGIVYGIGIPHLAELLGKDISEARSILNQFHVAVPFSKDTMKATIEEVGRTGICTTILGRQTHFDLWEPAAYGKWGMPLSYHAALGEYGTDIKRAGLYKALNYRLQGSGTGDVMKKGMLDCYEAGVFDATGVPRLTVHDELAFSEPHDVRDEAWREMQHLMEHCLDDLLTVPLRFDGKVGQHWAQCK